MEEALVPAFRMVVNYVVNGLLGPRTAPWKAKHEARAREIEARGDAVALLIQAEAHAEALKSVSSAYQDVAASSDFSLEAEHDLEGLVVQVMQHEHTRRQQNLLSVLAQAREYVGDAHVNDHEPDPDWTSRFFSDAQDVSSEGMQALWAKILAGEVERPGSTSIRTLGIMKDLDRSIAVGFRRLCTLSLTFALPDGSLIGLPNCILGWKRRKQRSTGLWSSFQYTERPERIRIDYLRLQLMATLPLPVSVAVPGQAMDALILR